MLILASFASFGSFGSFGSGMFWFQSSRLGSFRRWLQDVFLPWYNAYRFLVQESIVEFWVFGVRGTVAHVETTSSLAGVGGK